MTDQLRCPCGKRHSKKVTLTHLDNEPAQWGPAAWRELAQAGLIDAPAAIRGGITWDNHDWSAARVEETNRVREAAARIMDDFRSVRLGSWRV